MSDRPMNGSRPLSRRAMLLGATALAVELGSRTSSGAAARPRERWRVPGDDVAHERTWMAWPSSRQIWGRKLEGVQDDIALLAATIARYEPVVMCATNSEIAAAARARCGPSVEVIDSIPVDDCWMRDSGPLVRVNDAGDRDAFGLNFNAWGAKQRHRRDRHVARRVAGHLGLGFHAATVVGEGGGVECDGAGTLIATTSSWVDPDRNPGRTRSQIETDLLAAYGGDKLIWLPGVRGRDITDGHVDSSVRFVRPGVVMVQLAPPDRSDIWARVARRQHEILTSATDSRGRRLEVVTIEGPDHLPRWPRRRWSTFLDSYVNWVLTGDAVITTEFGDTPKDAAARDAIGAAFPGRKVVQLNLDRLHGNGGGGAHCVTMHEPRPREDSDEQRHR